MDGYYVSMFYSEIVPDYTVDACTAVVEVVVYQHYENGVLPLLALNEDCVATEKLERFHSVVRERDNRVVVVDCICDTKAEC